MAAEPLIDMETLAGLVGAKPVTVAPSLARAALATAWHLRLVPACPGMFDLAMAAPIMDTGRARRELGWSESHTAVEAVGELLEGIRRGAGLDTPPLSPSTGGPFRVKEFTTGVGRGAG